VLRRQSTAIAAVWCMYGFEQWSQASNVYFLSHGSLVNIFVGVVVLFAVLLTLVTKGDLFKNYPPVGWLVLCLFLYSFISVQWSPRIDLSYGIWGQYWPYCVTFLILTPLVLKDKRDLESIFNTFLIIGSILVALLAFDVEWFHRRVVLTGGNGGFRHYNIESLGNPLAIAQLGGYVFFVSMLTRGRANALTLLARYVIAAVCLVLIVRSGSRGQLIGVVVTLLISWPLANKITNLKGFASILIVCFIMFGAIGWALEEFWKGTSRWEDDAMEESMFGRLNNAFLLLDYWQKSILSMLFGLGNSASFDPDILGIYPHFLPLEILGEEGIIGFVIYLVIIVTIIKIVRNVYFDTRDDLSARQDFSILFSMVFYSMLLSLKQGSLLGNMELFTAVILLGKYHVLTKH
jgi:hypothetical protein